MKRLTDQERKWREILGTSTDPQEIIETAAKLEMDPVTMEEAEEIAEMHKPEKQEEVSLPWTKDELGNMIMSDILGEPLKKEGG